MALSIFLFALLLAPITAYIVHKVKKNKEYSQMMANVKTAHGTLCGLHFKTYYKSVPHQSTAYSSDGKLTYITSYESEKRIGSYVLRVDCTGPNGYHSIAAEELPGTSPDAYYAIDHQFKEGTMTYVTDKNGTNYFLGFRTDSPD